MLNCHLYSPYALARLQNCTVNGRTRAAAAAASAAAVATAAAEASALRRYQPIPSKPTDDSFQAGGQLPQPCIAQSLTARRFSPQRLISGLLHDGNCTPIGWELLTRPHAMPALFHFANATLLQHMPGITKRTG